MSGLAAGLARGLAGYMQGRQIAEERDYQRGEAERARQAAERREALNAEYMRAQVDAMQNNRANSARELQIREAEAVQRAGENGYIPAPQLAREANQMTAAAPAFGSMSGPNSLLMAAAAQAGGMGLAQRAQSPAFTLGGQGYVKGRDTRQEQLDSIARRNRELTTKADAERRANLLNRLSKDPEARALGEGLDLPSLEAFATTQFEKSRAPKPTGPAPSYDRVQTDDGVLYVNTRDPRQVVPLTVNGQPVKPSAPKRAGGDFTAARQLRGEYEKAIGMHRQTAMALTDLQASMASPPNAMNDVALVFKFMRSLDPNSTVREGEFATAKNAGGIPDRIRNAYNSAVSGQFLNEKQRAEMLGVAKARATALRPALQREMARYTGLAAKYGMDPTDVVFDPYTPDEVPSVPSALFTPMDQLRGRQVPAGAAAPRRPLSSYEVPR